jgi:predicted HD phosphohydrolase
MNADEAEVFESSPEFDSILALRQWDEMAKEPDLECAGLGAYRELLRAHLHRFSESPC